MSFVWTPHRFAGGALALDVANSVVLRHDPKRRADRFEEPAQLEAFPQAASRFSAERALFGEILPPAPENKRTFLELREAIDAYFRSLASGSSTSSLLAELLEAVARVLRRAEDQSLEAATAHSALRLLSEGESGRLKICGNCGWLFMDRSRNRSRTWCDMAVCGNRIKASRHYHRKKKQEDVL
jgi:predicted RNA-binding Zn ribbon-like protein